MQEAFIFNSSNKQHDHRPEIIAAATKIITTTTTTMVAAANNTSSWSASAIAHGCVSFGIMQPGQYAQSTGIPSDDTAEIYSFSSSPSMWMDDHPVGYTLEAWKHLFPTISMARIRNAIFPCVCFHSITMLIRSTLSDKGPRAKTHSCKIALITSGIRISNVCGRRRLCKMFISIRLSVSGCVECCCCFCSVSLFLRSRNLVMFDGSGVYVSVSSEIRCAHLSLGVLDFLRFPNRKQHQSNWLRSYVFCCS